MKGWSSGGGVPPAFGPARGRLRFRAIGEPRPKLGHADQGVLARRIARRFREFQALQGHPMVISRRAHPRSPSTRFESLTTVHKFGSGRNCERKSEHWIAHVL